MNGMVGYAWLAACLLGAILSLKSISVLRRRSAWTIAGWAATVVYVAIEAIAVVRATHAPAHADYIALGALTICFVVAGIRDEPQAEPGWWPTHAGLTGAERRAARG
jgi:hypothetical protein